MNTITTIGLDIVKNSFADHRFAAEPSVHHQLWADAPDFRFASA